MVKKFILAFAILSLVAAIAGTVPAGGPTYKINLLQSSVLKGTELKPGEYKLTVVADKATIQNGKVSVEVPAKVETVDKKFDNNAVRYVTQDGKQTICEIRVGGTKTKVVLNP